MKNVRIAGLATAVCFIILGFTSCSKKGIDAPISGIQAEARTELKAKMAPADFATLNWNESVVKNLNGKEFLLVIPSLSEAGKQLYFSDKAGIAIYNWAKLEVAGHSPSGASGKLTLTSISNEVLNTFEFANNRVIATSTLQPVQQVTAAGNHKLLTDEESNQELPPVTVVGYIHSSAYDYNSLYWLFNMNESFLPFFEGGGGDMPIVDANYNSNAFATPYTAYATRDYLPDGTAQITNLNPSAFLLAGLNLKFTYNPTTNQLNSASVTATTSGLFVGSWTGPTVANIVTTSSSISFTFTYTNAYTFSGITFSKDYKMKIDYNTSTNQIVWTWQ